MSPIVDVAEPIARFLRSSSHLRPGLGRAHYSAFMPPPGSSRDLSVYRTSDLTEPEIRGLGAAYVERGGPRLKGYATLLAKAVFEQRLDVQAAPNPHPRHANIVGWPSDPEARVVAKSLADASVLTCY